MQKDVYFCAWCFVFSRLGMISKKNPLIMMLCVLLAFVAGSCTSILIRSLMLCSCIAIVL